jgi:hypothetical protein
MYSSIAFDLGAFYGELKWTPEMVTIPVGGSEYSLVVRWSQHNELPGSRGRSFGSKCPHVFTAFQAGSVQKGCLQMTEG